MNTMLEHKKEIPDTIFYTVLFEDMTGFNFKCDNEVFEGDDILNISRQIPKDEGDDDVDVIGLCHFQSRNEYTDVKWKRTKDLHFVAIVENKQKEVSVLTITATVEYCRNILKALEQLTPCGCEIKGLFVYTHEEKAKSFAERARDILNAVKGDK